MILQHVLHNGEKVSGSRDIYIDIILCTRYLICISVYKLQSFVYLFCTLQINFET